MQTHQRLAVTLCLVPGLMASRPSVAQSSPLRGQRQVMQKVRRRDCMTSIFYMGTGGFIIES